MFIEEYAQLANQDGEDGRDNLKKLLAHATPESSWSAVPPHTPYRYPHLHRRD